jgi:hypothetical protein
MNRTLEDMLRHYVSPTHTDWDEHLDTAEFAINNGYQESIKTTPFHLNYGVHPKTPMNIDKDDEQMKCPAAENFTAAMQEQLEKAMTYLQAARERQKTYADQKRRDVTYKAKDMVMLSTQNIDVKSSGTRKLLPKFIGPFEIMEMIGEHAVRLQLPETYKMHNVFHVSLVKPYTGTKRHPPPCDFLEGEPLWTVERLLMHRKNKRKTEFLVKWEGFGLESYWKSVKIQESTTPEKRKATGTGPTAAKRTKR